MSIKIYHGYKLHIAPEDLMSFLIGFRDRIAKNEELLNLSQVFFAYERVYRLFGVPIEEYYKIKELLKKMYEDYIKWSIAIIPKKDCFLASLYLPNNRWLEEFERDERVEYYGYWNNSDKPENVSEEEWERRRKEWECLSYGVPVRKQALVYEPFTFWEFPSIEGIVKGTHSPESLRDIVAKEIYNKYVKGGISFHRFKWKIPLVTKELLLDTKLFLTNKYIKGEEL